MLYGIRTIPNDLSFFCILIRILLMFFSMTSLEVDTSLHRFKSQSSCLHPCLRELIVLSVVQFFLYLVTTAASVLLWYLVFSSLLMIFFTSPLLSKPVSYMMLSFLYFQLVVWLCTLLEINVSETTLHPRWRQLISKLGVALLLTDGW